MKEEQVMSVVDKSIIEKSLKNGDDFLFINKELHKRIESIFYIVKDDYDSILDLIKVDISDKSSKEKYAYYFIKHAMKRINDVHWMFYNKNSFKKYTNTQLFGLIKLKDLLSKKINK